MGLVILKHQRKMAKLLGSNVLKSSILFHLDFNPSCFVAWTVSPSSKSVYRPVLLQIYLQYHELLLSYSETSLSIIHVTCDNKNPITTPFLVCRRPATSYHHPGCGCSALRSPSLHDLRLRDPSGTLNARTVPWWCRRWKNGVQHGTNHGIFKPSQGDSR